MKEFIHRSFAGSTLLSRIFVVLGALFVALVIFTLGVAVGHEQAEFASRWESHYAAVFNGPGSPFMPGSGRDDVAVGDGAAGQVVAVELPTVAVKGPDDVEKVVLVGSSTIVRMFHDIASSSAIRVGDILVAIGQPDSQGRIVASFVRVVPPPPSPFGATSSPFQP